MGNPRGNNGGRFYSPLVEPVLIDCSFIVDDTNGLGINSLKGNGLRNVFMHTATTPTSNRGYLNPNPLAGYALIQLDNNYSRFCALVNGIASPNTGSNIAINASALTANQPYVITGVGTGPAGVCTIAPVADSAGSLASTYFKLFDAYGNVFIIWFSVSGVGTAPSGVSGTLVQQSILSGATAAQIGAALVLTINALPIAPGSATMSFTSAGTTTVTCTSTSLTPLAGIPQDGAIATGFTFALTKYNTNLDCWRGVGLPRGVTPAIGAAFVATATGFSTGGGSTGTVKLPSVSTNFGIEVIGDPNLSMNRSPLGGTAHTGGFICVQFLAPTINTGAYVAPMIPAAPAAGSTVRMTFLVEQSTVLINGD